METLNSRQVYANAWISVREDAVRRPDGSEGIYAVIDRPTVAIVVPRADDGSLHLVEQFRYPLGARRWEFPMGTAPDRAEQDPAELAVRELAEETGLTAGRMEHLGTIDVAAGMSSQRGHVYLATDLTEGTPHREHTEQDMRTSWFTADEFEAMVRDGGLPDAQSLAAFALLQLSRGPGRAGTPGTPR
ncbi:NUDIX domain-containing protein [Pseudonocardia endophytica]|uniref:NUDIX domain-containing protein n=1 Tax=Pseudonocardia endophytica TaxID=401976 RepID=UPI003C74860D